MKSFENVSALNKRLKKSQLNPRKAGPWDEILIHGQLDKNTNLVHGPTIICGPFDNSSGDQKPDNLEEISISCETELKVIEDPNAISEKPVEETSDVTLVIQYRIAALKKGHIER